MVDYFKYTNVSRTKCLKPDIPEFDRKCREIAQRDRDGFAKEQHEYIKKKYYNKLQ